MGPRGNAVTGSRSSHGPDLFFESIERDLFRTGSPSPDSSSGFVGLWVGERAMRDLRCEGDKVLQLVKWKEESFELSRESRACGVAFENIRWFVSSWEYDILKF